MNVKSFSCIFLGKFPSLLVDSVISTSVNVSFTIEHSVPCFKSYQLEVKNRVHPFQNLPSRFTSPLRFALIPFTPESHENLAISRGNGAGGNSNQRGRIDATLGKWKEKGWR
jgi:hypothetical protein